MLKDVKCRKPLNAERRQVQKDVKCRKPLNTKRC